ncbi:MAG: S46 family peptidase [Owenweeksia sp.]|nr:S46 family peptidase [Owenweeksia sp.]
MDPSEVEEFVEDLYADLLLVQEPEEWQNLLKEKPAKALKKLQKSEAMQLTLAGWDYFLNTINTQTRAYNDTIYPLQAQYLKAMQRVFPNKAIYPDANSSLRVSYGQVQGYEPRDAVTYEPQTFLSGVIAKYVPGDYEFDLPIKLIELYADRDYGRYGQQGKMPVCFIATNHTTGGNSGSPALNGNGELIGLNFDRAWEGTMSDYTYDPSICRNIMVDIRYVLFIIDKFAGAGYLVDEMDLVSQERKAPAPAEKAKPEVVPTEG